MRAVAICMTAATLVALPALADAGELRALEPGATYDFEDGRGTRLRLVLTDATDGRSWALYAADAEDGSAPLAQYAEDAEGRTVRLVQGGIVYRFRPHDCSRSLGVCAFEMEGPDRTTRYQRLTGREQGAWVYSLFEERGADLAAVRIGSVSYDADGVPLSEDWTDLESVASGTLTRVKPAQ